MLVQGVSDNQTSHFALVEALSSGTTHIDSFGAETDDKVTFEGHLYSNKAPGLAFATVAPYKLLRSTGLAERLRSAAADRGTQRERAEIWALGLIGVVLPAGALLLLVRLLGERAEPGFGSLAAVTVGVCTLLLPFSTMFFSHVLAALLGFSAFALLWREREGGSRVRVLGLAGLLCGLAVTTEYPLAVVAVILGAYALAGAPRLRRAAWFAGGAVVGILPLTVYNAVAFGDPLHNSYSGFEEQNAGLFGVRVPKLDVAIDLLFSGKGLLVMSPVVVAAAIGTVLLYRSGRRAEAIVIAAVAVAVFIYNAGYYRAGSPNHPFGGFGPGPRLLVTMLPFLGIGLAPAWRRVPWVTAVLALWSAAWLLTATITEPLVGQDTSPWLDRLKGGDFTATVLTELGAGHGWGAILPFLALVATAAVLAVAATPWRLRRQ